METVFNYTDREHGFFSSDERKFINLVRKLKDKYPDKVRIIAEPEDNDGCIYCELPPAWLKIAPKRVLSEEEKAKQAEICRRNFRLSPEPRLQTEFSDRTGGSDASDEYLST